MTNVQALIAMGLFAVTVLLVLACINEGLTERNPRLSDRDTIDRWTRDARATRRVTRGGVDRVSDGPVRRETWSTTPPGTPPVDWEQEGWA